jgi:hypothetical protein
MVLDCSQSYSLINRLTEIRQMKRMKTRIIKNAGSKYQVFTEFGKFHVFLSSSIQQRFTIGNITFEAIGGYPSNGFKPNIPIPKSWTIDISQESAF